MPRKNTFFEMRWTLNQNWFSVWGVRDYYTNLEQRAIAGAEITFGYVLMVIISAFLATGGLLLNSPAIVIGSMCVAPFLGASRAVCIGGLFHNHKVMLGGLAKQLLGLVVIGAGVAYALTSLLQASVPGIEITPEILLRAMPTMREAVLSIIVAISAGVAASLSLTADPKIVETPWGQVVDAVIGVEIAISLIPPASVIGIGLAFGQPNISYNAFLLMIVNVLGLDLFGSMFMLAFRGIRYKHLVMEKKIRQAVEFALIASPINWLGEYTINVTLLGDDIATIQAKVRNQPHETPPTDLARSITAFVYERTGFRSEVTLEIVPAQISSTL